MSRMSSSRPSSAALRPSQVASSLKRALKYEASMGGQGYLELELTEEIDQPVVNEERPFLRSIPGSEIERQRALVERERRSRRKKLVEGWSSLEMKDCLLKHPYFSTILVSPPIEEQDGSIRKYQQSLPDALYTHQIDGKSLLELTSSDIKECFGVRQIGVVKSILRNIQGLLDPNLDLESFVEESLALHPHPASSRPAEFDESSSIQSHHGDFTPGTRPSSAAMKSALLQGTSPSSRPSTAAGRPTSASSSTALMAAGNSSTRPASASSLSSLNPFSLWDTEHEQILNRMGTRKSSQNKDRHLPPRPGSSPMVAKSRSHEMTHETSVAVEDAQLTNKQINSDLLDLLDEVADPGIKAAFAPRPELERNEIAIQTLPEGQLVVQQLAADLNEKPSEGLLEKEKRYTVITDLHNTLEAGLDDGLRLGWLVNVSYYQLPEDKQTKSADPAQAEEDAIRGVIYWDDTASLIAACGTKIKKKRKEVRAKKRAQKRAAKEKKNEELGKTKQEPRRIPSNFDTEQREKGEQQSRKKRERTARFADEGEQPPPETTAQAAEGEEEEVGVQSDREEGSEEGEKDEGAELQGEAGEDALGVRFSAHEEEKIVSKSTKEARGVSPHQLERFAALSLNLEEYRTVLLDLTDHLNIPEFDHFAKAMSLQHGKDKIEGVRRRTAISLVFDRCEHDDFGVVPSEFVQQLAVQYCQELRKEDKTLSSKTEEEWLKDFEAHEGFFLASEKPRRPKRSNRGGGTDLANSTVGALDASLNFSNTITTVGGVALSPVHTQQQQRHSPNLMDATASSIILSGTVPISAGGGAGGGQEDELSQQSRDTIPSSPQNNTTHANTFNTMSNTHPLLVIWNGVNFVAWIYDELKSTTSEDFDLCILRLKSIVERMMSVKRGLDDIQISPEGLIDTFLPKTSKTRPVVICYSSVVDPGNLVENIFQSCRQTAKAQAASVGRNRRVRGSRPSSAMTSIDESDNTTSPTTPTQQDSILAPSIRQRKLCVYSVASAESEDAALRSVERDGIALGSWIYVSFPRNAIDKPFLPFVGDEAEQDSASALNTSETQSAWSGTETTLTSTVIGGSGGMTLTGQMNEFLRKVARLLATRRASLVHERFRLFCHCPLDFIDANNIPTLARSVCVFVPLLHEKTRKSIPHALAETLNGSTIPSELPKEARDERPTEGGEETVVTTTEPIEETKEVQVGEPSVNRSRIPEVTWRRLRPMPQTLKILEQACEVAFQQQQGKLQDLDNQKKEAAETIQSAARNQRAKDEVEERRSRSSSPVHHEHDDSCGAAPHINQPQDERRLSSSSADQPMEVTTAENPLDKFPTEETAVLRIQSAARGRKAKDDVEERRSCSPSPVGTRSEGDKQEDNVLPREDLGVEEAPVAEGEDPQVVGPQDMFPRSYLLFDTMFGKWTKIEPVGPLSDVDGSLAAVPLSPPRKHRCEEDEEEEDNAVVANDPSSSSREETTQVETRYPYLCMLAQATISEERSNLAALFKSV